VPGVNKVEWLVIDDGSSDRTSEVARECGVDYVVRLPQHHGLAKAFSAGLDACLRNGADVIVNTDADNQYCAKDIPKLIDPILAGNSSIVVGARPISEIAHFSPAKKLLQRFGSWIVRLASNTTIPDAPSGFRAFSREAAMRLNVFSAYTYTLETIIQAGHKNIAITSVPIRTNGHLRKSRLMTSMTRYIRSSILIILRIFMTYQPARFFGAIGMIIFLIGLFPTLRFLYFYFIVGDGSGHIQSLVLSAMLLSTGFNLMVTGLVTDLIAVNRQLMEEARFRLLRIEYRINGIRDKT
jgi:glycosyltransferase involved in cell wall biosynthesis